VDGREWLPWWHPIAATDKIPLGARQVVYESLHLVFLSFSNHNTIQHVGAPQTRRSPFIITITFHRFLSIIILPSVHHRLSVVKQEL
jgi:hypothetical protein